MLRRKHVRGGCGELVQKGNVTSGAALDAGGDVEGDALPILPTTLSNLAAATHSLHHPLIKHLHLGLRGQRGGRRDAGAAAVAVTVLVVAADVGVSWLLLFAAEGVLIDFRPRLRSMMTRNASGPI